MVSPAQIKVCSFKDFFILNSPASFDFGTVAGWQKWRANKEIVIVDEERRREGGREGFSWADHYLD